MRCNFSYKHYQEILQTYQKDHRFIFFNQAKKTPGEFVILRHDIDYSLESALEMAKIDHHLRIQSTFFMMINSPYYNIFDLKSFKIIKKILNLGHQLGFHYDGELIQASQLSPGQYFRENIGFLEKTFQTKIDTITRHNPSVDGIKQAVPPRYLDGYSSFFTKKVKYLSDSCQQWTVDCPCQISSSHPRLQLLFHPFLWTKEGKILSRIRSELTQDKIEKFKKLEVFFRRMNRQRIQRMKKF